MKLKFSSFRLLENVANFVISFHFFKLKDSYIVSYLFE